MAMCRGWVSRGAGREVEKGQVEDWHGLNTEGFRKEKVVVVAVGGSSGMRQEK